MKNSFKAGCYISKGFGRVFYTTYHYDFHPDGFKKRNHTLEDKAIEYLKGSWKFVLPAEFIRSEPNEKP